MPALDTDGRRGRGTGRETAEVPPGWVVVWRRDMGGGKGGKGRKLIGLLGY